MRSREPWCEHWWVSYFQNVADFNSHQEEEMLKENYEINDETTFFDWEKSWSTLD